MEHTGLLGLHVDHSLLDCPGSPLLPLNPGPFVTRLCSKQQLRSSHKPTLRTCAAQPTLTQECCRVTAATWLCSSSPHHQLQAELPKGPGRHAVARSCMGPMLAWPNCHSRLFSFTVLCMGTALCVCRTVPRQKGSQEPPQVSVHSLSPAHHQCVTVSFLSNNAHLGVKLLPADSRLLGDQALHANSGEASLCRGARHALRCSAPVVPQAGRHGRHGCLQRKILGTVMQVVF